MKKLLLTLALVLVFTPITLAGDAPDVELATSEALGATEQIVEVALETNDETLVIEQNGHDVVLADLGLPTTVLESVMTGASASYECPSYTIYCWTGSQCDNYCGAVGAGSCFQGCCSCLF